MQKDLSLQGKVDDLVTVREVHMRYEIEYSCLCHIGNVRKINQDNLVCEKSYREDIESNIPVSLNGSVKPEYPTIFGVFDGIGGEEHGEIASLIAAKMAAETKFTKKSVTSLWEYCKRVNSEICDYTEHNSISAMGTTAAIILFCKKDITLCNIGDSKTFRLSRDEVVQVSKDHVALAPYGQKPPLSQNLGISPSELVIEPYIIQEKYKKGDKYLICSDGLTDMVSAEECKEIVDCYGIQRAVSVLIDAALDRGGRDNITVILIELK